MEVLYSFEGVCSSRERGNLGDNSGGVTPVPIPNTEVKHFSGENSRPSACEDSTLPGIDP